MKFFNRETIDDDTAVVLAASLGSLLISLASFFGSDNNISFIAVPVVVLLAVRFIYSSATGFFQTKYVLLGIGIITVIAILSTFL